MIRDSRHLWRTRWVALAPLALLYLSSLPRTVQSLDTGELVASAWRLTVPHPPGYPLYVWLQHAAMTILPWGSVFHRAALVNSLCVLGACALLLKLCRDWLGVALVLVMGTLPLVWRYAVLPDVFGLHLLLAAALIAIAFAGEPTPRRTFAGALVFGLAAANHQTIIFLAPLLGLIVVEERSRARAIGALGLGFLVTVGLYTSLLALDTNNIASWGSLGGVHDLLRHFLRGDYGSLALSGHESGVDLSEVVIAFATSLSGLGLAALALIVTGGATTAREWRRHRAWWVLLICSVAYVVVILPASNLGSHPIAVAIRERFFLFPTLLLTALAVTTQLRLAKAWLRPALAGALTIGALAQAAIGDTRDLANDTVVEDYARNLLNSAASGRSPGILLVDSDTKAFATRYVQATEPGYDDVIILSRGNMFDVRTLEKIKRKYSQFNFDPDVVKPGGARDIFRQFIAPNMEAFAFTYVMPTTSPRGHTTFYPLGRRVEPGSGAAIADTERPLSPNPPIYHADELGYVETKDLYSEYAVYHLARGRILLESGDREGARAAFVTGLTIVPYCIPCLQNICALDKTDDCRAALRDLEEKEHDYFR